MMAVIMVGTPLDGLTLYGPFEDSTEAVKFADSILPDTNWWVAEVKDREEIRDEL